MNNDVVYNAYHLSHSSGRSASRSHWTLLPIKNQHYITQTPAIKEHNSEGRAVRFNLILPNSEALRNARISRPHARSSHQVRTSKFRMLQWHHCARRTWPMLMFGHNAMSIESVHREVLASSTVTCRRCRPRFPI